MQIDRKDYNPDQHDMVKALCVKQPYADLLTRVVSRDESGAFQAEKTIEVRTRNINYRGDILICSSAKPELPAHMSGVTCGFVELYGTKPVAEFTAEDWAATCIPEQDRPKAGWGWLMRNPRRVVEMPVKGQLGLYNLIVPKDDITIYPQNVAMGADGWKIVKSKLNR
jgi:hypothetical protein